jgi:hypothetical protein
VINSDTLDARRNSRAANALRPALATSTGLLPTLSEIRPVRNAENVKTSPQAAPINPISIQLAPIRQARSGEIGKPRPIANMSRNVNAYCATLVLMMTIA